MVKLHLTSPIIRTFLFLSLFLTLTPFIKGAEFKLPFTEEDVKKYRIKDEYYLPENRHIVATLMTRISFLMWKQIEQDNINSPQNNINSPQNSSLIIPIEDDSFGGSLYNTPLFSTILFNEEFVSEEANDPFSNRNINLKKNLTYEGLYYYIERLNENDNSFRSLFFNEKIIRLKDNQVSVIDSEKEDSPPVSKLDHSLIKLIEWPLKNHFINKIIEAKQPEEENKLASDLLNSLYAHYSKPTYLRTYWPAAPLPESLYRRILTILNDVKKLKRPLSEKKFFGEHVELNFYEVNAHIYLGDNDKLFGQLTPPYISRSPILMNLHELFQRLNIYVTHPENQHEKFLMSIDEKCLELEKLMRNDELTNKENQS